MVNMTLSQGTIEIMLEQLKTNQEELRKDYIARIDDLSKKMDKILEKVDNLPQQFVTRVEYDFVKEKISSLEEGRKKIIWIIITAVVGAVLGLVFVHNGTI